MRRPSLLPWSPRATRLPTVLTVLVLLASPALLRAADDVAPPPDKSKETPGGTADHRKFPQLKVPFATGPDVTAACIECHTEAARQIMNTSHWTWICPRAKQELAERQGREVGKGEHVINNFCVALGSNEPRCTSCHAGYGWADKTFNFNNQTLVDCLVCHDRTGKYKKFPTGAGHPAYEDKEWPPKSGKIWPAMTPSDLSEVAQNVGRPTRDNCGTCHFWGGGGEGVKHGDMDASLSAPDKSLDVHMCADGNDFLCTECHTTHNHEIAGRCFTIPAYDDAHYVMRGAEQGHNMLACESCHDARPHHDKKLNDHTNKVACQTCHIPTFARQKPTKMWWDWSKAGEMGEDGKPMTKMGEVAGSKVPVYDTKKGSFVWAKDAKPEYRWFNGHVSHTFIGDEIDDATPGAEAGFLNGEFDKLDLSKPVVALNTLEGSYDDPTSRIWPVKFHRGLQPYDPGNKSLVVPKLFGPKGSGSYWSAYDWDTAITTGMEYVEQPYSGEFDWIQTEMAWPLSHMIAPGDEALQCDDCHAPQGRLSELEGFYMPGRDRSTTLDWLGLAAIAVTCVGVIGHAGLRFGLRRKGEQA